MGVSQWREHGKKFGYWEFFEKELETQGQAKMGNSGRLLYQQGFKARKIETHTACDERIKKYGGNAQCCYCSPHENCKLNLKFNED